MRIKKSMCSLAIFIIAGMTAFAGGNRVKADDEYIVEIDRASQGEPDKATTDVPDKTVIDVNDSTVMAEDSADSKWIKDYDYICFTDGDVVLLDYLGIAEEVTVYKHATINGIKYNTVLDKNENGSIWWSGTSSTSWRRVKKITFEDGFVFPKDCSGLFENCMALESIDLSGVDTSKATNMENMFKYCSNLKELNLSAFNTKKVTNMNGMFYYCSSLEKLNVSSFNTRNVVSAGNMFYGCGSLKYLNLSGFDFRNLKENTDPDSKYRVSKMLGCCWELKTLNIPLNLNEDVKQEYSLRDAKGNWYEALPKGLSTSKKLVIHRAIWEKSGENWYYLLDNVKYENQTPFFGYGEINGVKGWYIVNKGEWDKKLTGLVQYDGKNGWGFAKKGKLDTSFKGIARATNGKWYYVNKGKIDSKFTGKIAQTTNGKWYYCTNGKPDLKFSGKIAYCTNGSWYYVTKGRIDRSFTGIAEATNGKKYYVEKGLLNKNYTGTVKYNGKTYKIVKGAVK